MKEPEMRLPQDAQKPGGSMWSVYLILAGIVVTGLAAGYSWLRRLPKD